MCLIQEYLVRKLYCRTQPGGKNTGTFLFRMCPPLPPAWLPVPGSAVGPAISRSWDPGGKGGWRNRVAVMGVSEEKRSHGEFVFFPSLWNEKKITPPPHTSVEPAALLNVARLKNIKTAYLERTRILVHFRRPGLQWDSLIGLEYNSISQLWGGVRQLLFTPNTYGTP